MLIFKKHNGPTPADDIAPQTITDCVNLTLDFKQLVLWASPPFLQTLGPWFPNEIQNVLSSEKRTLDHWATVQFFFSLAQVKTGKAALQQLKSAYTGRDKATFENY